MRVLRSRLIDQTPVARIIALNLTQGGNYFGSIDPKSRETSDAAKPEVAINDNDLIANGPARPLAPDRIRLGHLLSRRDRGYTRARIRYT
jgi:hypothetical protein